MLKQTIQLNYVKFILPMKSSRLIIYFLFIFNLQLFANPTPTPFNINLHKFGPYIGLQRGAYTSIEFGAEYQLKTLAWFKPTTHAAHFGFNYNLFHNVLGADYTRSTLGFTPLIGFKFSQLHLQTGYNFLLTASPPKAVNGFFVSLRFVFIQNTIIDIDK